MKPAQKKKAIVADARGAVALTIAGVQMKLEPSFMNLAAAEEAIGRSAVAFLMSSRRGEMVLTEVAKIVHACAIPAAGGKYPDDWSVDFVGQAMFDEGMDDYIVATIEMLGRAMSAKPKQKLGSGGGGAGEA
jgi:hypothetical protein